MIQVTEPPHTGCKKFAGAMGWMPEVRQLTGRQAPPCCEGINARVIRPGTIGVGDVVTKC